MGTLPPTKDYELGNACAVCESSLFDGVTPKYVEIDVTLIDNCPTKPGIPPDGTYLLTQTGNPCLWLLDNGSYVFRWELTAVKSFLTIHTMLAIWFAAEIDDTCIDAFANQNDCSNPQEYGVNGYVTCWWGPLIGP